jgi:hypothetical protein
MQKMDPEVLQEIDEEGASELCIEDLYRFLGVTDDGSGHFQYEDVAEAASELELEVEEHGYDSFFVSRKL